MCKMSSNIAKLDIDVWHSGENNGLRWHQLAASFSCVISRLNIIEVSSTDPYQLLKKKKRAAHCFLSLKCLKNALCRISSIYNSYMYFERVEIQNLGVGGRKFMLKMHYCNFLSAREIAAYVPILRLVLMAWLGWAAEKETCGHHLPWSTDNTLNAHFSLSPPHF